MKHSGSPNKLKRARAAEDKENAGWQAYRAGMIYYFRNQPAEVLACAARAFEDLQDSTPRDKGAAIQLRGHGHTLKQEYSNAITAYREVFDICCAISPESNDVVAILGYLADAERHNKDYPAAEHNYREALRIAKINKNNEQIAAYTGNLAGLALDHEQWAEAESLAREALPLSEKVGRQELIAHDSHVLAKALLKQNKNLEEALSLSRRAVEIFTRLRHPELQSAQETLGEIEKKIKRE